MRILQLLSLVSILALPLQAAVTQVNVLSFGAKGNGTSDDTVAVQRWLASAGGEYVAPVGNYLCKSDIAFPRNGNVRGFGVPIGAGSDGTVFTFTGGHGFTHSSADDQFDFLYLQGFSVRGSGSGIGIKFVHSHQTRSSDLRIVGFYDGISVDTCWDNRWDNIQSGANSHAGFAMYNTVTDQTWTRPQFSNNNGYGLFTQPDSANNQQLCNIWGGSAQYNKLGNWINGGLSWIVSGLHTEGNMGPDLMLGSATNRCTGFTFIGGHHDWSDAQYDFGVATWPGATFSYYQVVLSNAWGTTFLNEEFSNVAATPSKNRAAVWASALCDSPAMINCPSSYLQPVYVGEVPPTRTSSAQNLIENGLMVRDERNPNNYPYTWITDYPYPDLSFSSQTVPNVLGYTYSGVLTNGRSFYPTNAFSLTTNKFYTYTTLMKGGAGELVMQRLVDHNQWNGGSNDVYQTVNIITNTGNYLWVVSRFNCVDQYHRNPYLFTTCLQPGKQTVEIGEISFVEGFGIGGPQLSDAYTSDSTTWPTYAADIPNQGTWPTGKFIWNDGSTVTNAVGWYCLTGGTPGTWGAVGIPGLTVLSQTGTNVTVNGNLSVVGLIATPIFNATALNTSTLTITNNVGIGTNVPTAKLEVVTSTAYDGVRINGTQNPLLTIAVNNVVESFLGTASIAGTVFSDAQANDTVIRAQNDRVLLGGSGTGPSSVVIDKDTSAGNTRFMLWDVTAGTLKRVSVGINDSGGAGFKLLRVAN